MWPQPLTVANIGIASYGSLGYVLRPPSTSNNLIFSFHFRAAQSLTATLCGCLSKHICIQRQQLRSFSRGYTNLVHCIISHHFVWQKVSYTLCHPLCTRSWRHHWWSISLTSFIAKTTCKTAGSVNATVKREISQQNYEWWVGEWVAS